MCKMCDKTFTNSHALRCHLNRVHEIYGVSNMVQTYGHVYEKE